MYDVLTFGSATRDVFLRSKSLELHEEHGIMEACFPFGAKLNVEDVTLTTGGGATNNAATFSRLGKFKTAAVCRVGDDALGDEIVDDLKEERVATCFVQRDARAATAYSTILLSGIAERTILTYRGASLNLDPESMPWRNMRSKLFHISSLGGNLDLLEKIIRHGKRAGALLYMNPGEREFRANRPRLKLLLEKLDALFVNREEASALTGVSAKDLRSLIRSLRKLCRHSIMTDGSAGSYSIFASGSAHASTIPAKRVNLTGAGDAFGSGYAAAMLNGAREPEALAVGTLNATSVVGKMGPKTGIRDAWPSAAEIRRIKIKKLPF